MFTAHEERERGQSIVIIAFIVVVLLALVAVVVDVGNAYAQRRVVQNAVDSATMAGVKVLTIGLQTASDDVFFNATDDEVQTAILDYAQQNGLDPNNVTAWYIDSRGQSLRAVGITPGERVPRQMQDSNGAWQDVTGVWVKGDLPFDTYFAHLLGFRQMTASAPAKAWVLSGPCRANALFPIALDVTTFEDDPDGLPVENKSYTMWDNVPNEPGNFGWVNWGDEGLAEPGGHAQGPSEQALVQNMHWNSRSGAWEVGDWVPGSSGEMPSNNSRNEIECRIEGADANPDCDEYNSSATVVIPIYGASTGQGNGAQYQIEGFGAFHLTCYRATQSHQWGDCSACDDHPSNKCVIGYFEKMVTPQMDDGCMNTGITAPSFRQPEQP